DERFSLLRISARGSGMAATIQSFVRTPPVTQQSVAEIAQSVDRNEFAGVNALIVGGSRGLGEFSAKAIAAGGGKVTITYASGRADAERVEREITEAAGRCEHMIY